MKDLARAILCLKTEKEVEAFLKDILTPQEIDATAERWEIARLLDEKKMSYRDISTKTGSSTTTVSRVARFLNHEPHHGYKLVLERLAN